MSVKPTSSSNPSPLLRKPETAPSNPLAKVGHALQNAARSVSTNVHQAVDTFEAKLPTLNRPAGTKPWAGITLTGKPLQIPLDALKKVDIGDLRNVLERIFPPKVHDEQGKQLVEQTKDFRDTLGQVRQLSLELGMTSPASPRYAELQKQLATTEGHLKADYGYTRTTAPRPGSLWVDPQFFAKELPGGKLNASRFPTGTPVTKPPAPMDFLFGKGPRELKLGEGSSVRTAHTPEEYRAAVAARRAELGMPVKDGEPVGVHLSLQGGGGKGKRYGAMLAEMYDLGVVPTSLSGTSAGSIAAAFAAAGAGPEEIQNLAKDPRLSDLYDFDLDMKDGGILNGQKAFDLVDQELRRMTGITDRPVTFADLKVPLQILATKDYDSGGSTGTTAKDRIFVFSQETTPDTPVALAVRASMAIPGVFEPVQVVDPTTGRRMHLTDGGALDNLPTGNLDTTNVLWNALNGYTLMKDSASDYNDYMDRTQPKSNQFMLSLPTWDLNDPSKSDSTLKFGYDAKVDPALDGQSREVTRDFLRNFLDDLRVPGSKGTNYSASVPKDVHFDLPVDVKGKRYQVSYSGGDMLVAKPADGGKPIELKVGKQRIEAMYLDNQAFGDLKSQLAYTLSNPKSVKPSWLPF
jgi:NTE family protein